MGYYQDGEYQYRDAYPRLIHKENVHADLMIAKNIIYNRDFIGHNDYLFNQATYHSVQAIEKCLKQIIARNGIVYDRTHNICELISDVEQIKGYENFGREHPQISDNAYQYTKIASKLRYDSAIISEQTAFETLQIAKAFYKEVYGEDRSKFKTSSKQNDYNFR